MTLTAFQIFAAALTGVPLSALSFSYGMVTALGNEASALMLLSRFVLLASVCAPAPATMNPTVLDQLSTSYSAPSDGRVVVG